MACDRAALLDGVDPLTARIDTRCEHVQTAGVEIARIVNRTGSGKASATGVLHALRNGSDIAAAADFALLCSSTRYRATPAAPGAIARSLLG